MDKPANYYDGINLKLFNSIPKEAGRVLELGCANGRLGKIYKEANPQAKWIGVDFSDDAVTTASRHLDHVFKIDLNRDGLDALNPAEKFDVVVIGDLLEHLIYPDTALDQLHNITTPDAKILCCLPNMSNLSVVQRLLCGDMSYDEMGLLDKTHLRLYSPASAFKVFLDSGWLPNLCGQYRATLPDTEFFKRIIHASDALGVPAATATRNLGMYQMIVDCIKWQPTLKPASRDEPALSVIVPVNRQWEYDLNIVKSPGLREINAEIICVKDAKSAAEAYATGCSAAKSFWRLMVHQDVYFPAGTGHALTAALKSLEQNGHTASPVGFAGLAVTEENKLRFAGMVIDRTARFTHQGSTKAVSIDEFAVAMHKNTSVTPDPNLGWHTWATDLCLQAANHSGEPDAVILELPLFHNSLNPYVLPESYHASAARLLAKYPDMEKIHTLCGSLSR